MRMRRCSLMRPYVQQGLLPLPLPCMNTLHVQEAQGERDHSAGGPLATCVLLAACMHAAWLQYMADHSKKRLIAIACKQSQTIPLQRLLKGPFTAYAHQGHLGQHALQCHMMDAASGLQPLNGNARGCTQLLCRL